eukprot:gene823-1029_t
MVEFKEFSSFPESVVISTYYIGIDIGGTNTRVVFSEGKNELYNVLTFPASSITHLYEGLLKAQDILLTKTTLLPKHCCIDIAGPSLNDDEYDLTNYIVTDRRLNRKHLPKVLCPYESTTFLNDLESGCYGLVSLLITSKESDVFKPFVKRTTATSKNVVYVVLAAGTGLGAGIIYKSGDQYTVIASEFGHITVCPYDKNHPSYQVERQFFDAMESHLEQSEKDKRKVFSVEYEDIVSGRGLVATYDILKKQGTESLSSVKISQQAIENKNNPNDDAFKSMLTHYRYLMRAAREMCVGLYGKGVYLMGDNMVKNKEVISAFEGELMNEFMNHPKTAWLEKVSVYAQDKLENLNLLVQ